MMSLSGALFALGGTGNWRLAHKNWRRIGVPVVSGFCLIVLGIKWFVSVPSSIILWAVLTLGYGERKPYWYKFLVGCSYSLPSLLVGLSWWQIITPIGFTTLFFASNKLDDKSFVWKICEFAYGSLISFCYVGSMSNRFM